MMPRKNKGKGLRGNSAGPRRHLFDQPWEHDREPDDEDLGGNRRTRGRDRGQNRVPSGGDPQPPRGRTGRGPQPPPYSSPLSGYALPSIEDPPNAFDPFAIDEPLPLIGFGMRPHPTAVVCANCLEWYPHEEGGRGSCHHPGSGFVAPWPDTPGCPFFHSRR